MSTFIDNSPEIQPVLEKPSVKGAPLRVFQDERARNGESAQGIERALGGLVRDSGVDLKDEDQELAGLNGQLQDLDKRTEKLLGETEASSPIEKLKPYEFEDADGTKRQVFTFQTPGGHEVKAVFYAKEDLPFNAEVVEGKTPFILGDKPVFRATEWDGFVHDIQNASADKDSDPLNIDRLDRKKVLESGQAIIFIENTPKNMLDAAFVLGLEGKNWREARKAASQGKYTPDAVELIDNLIAATAVDDKGELQRRKNQEGEALVLSSLLGDQSASAEIAKKKQVMEQRDQKTQKELADWCKARYEALAKEGIKPANEHIEATHVTRRKPVVTPEGVLIDSTYDVTRGKVFRNTIHFTLSGPVSNELGGGGWGAMDYIVEGDLKAIRDRNGNPRMMSQIDTYFTTSPGEPLVIPNAHVTMPGRLPDGVVRETRGNVTIYKKSELSIKDIDAFISEYGPKSKMDYEIMRIDRQLEGLLRVPLWGKISAESDKTEDPDKFRREKYPAFEEFYDSLKPNEFLGSLGTKGIVRTVENILEKYPGEFSQEEKDKLCKSINNWLTEKIRNGSFYEHTGSAEYSERQKEIQMLAVSWEAGGSQSRRAHFEDSEGLGTEHQAYRVFIAVEDQKKLNEKWRKEGIDILPPAQLETESISLYDRKEIMEAVRKRRGFLSEDPKTRRMHYLAGLI